MENCKNNDRVSRHFDEIGTRLAFSGRTKIFEQSQSSNGVFVVRLGRVKLFMTSKDGRTLLVRFAYPGDMLGLSAALNDLPYEVTAETVVPSELINVRRRDFLGLLETCPEVGQLAAQALAREYREVFSDVRRLALCGSAAGRLASLLLDRAHSAAWGKADLRFPMALTHQELANIVGTSRETVTRLLNRFERDRLLARRGVSLVILDPSRLSQLAD